jgi:predicted 3-demethylubiquinone-9 3-methyltransferase (glyoxalase superfamily)
MQKITPFLWFDSNAEEAINFYLSIFKDSKLGTVSRYTDAGPGPAGSVMVANFTLNGMEFAAINGGPIFTPSEAISFAIQCDTQEEVDHYWDKLTEGGEPSQCGWLKDPYGFSWQVVPKLLGQLMSDKDPKRVSAVTKAMLQMHKLDSAKLQAAYDAAV